MSIDNRIIYLEPQKPFIDEPISVRERVSDQWDEMPIPDRLVAVSPIPLNEEQRKIIAALDDPDCRFITVQGPPGTGKSYTITAIAFNCILTGKNVLILYLGAVPANVGWRCSHACASRD